MSKISKKVLCVLGSMDELSRLGLIKAEETDLLLDWQLAEFDQIKSSDYRLESEEVATILKYCNLVEAEDRRNLTSLIVSYFNNTESFCSVLGLDT